MKGKFIQRLFHIVPVLLIAGVLNAQPPAGPLAISPQVNPDKTVTFRYFAPSAREVRLSAQFEKGPVAMTKAANGMWSVTLGPVKPDIYPYNFIVDGIQVMDPGNVAYFPNERFKASLVDIPGDKPLIHSLQDVPHGTMVYTSYKSKVMNGIDRPLVVYTPPGYETSPGQKYPVLYLISGTTDTEETWFKVGRVNFILDNLIAQGKAVPMIIVMPYGNNFIEISGPASPDAIPMYSKYSDEMVNDIIPFTDRNFRTVADREHRAVAGFSRGGGQSLWTGLSNTDKFAYICSFSAYLTKEAFEQNFSSFYSKPEETNKRMKLFWLSVGNEDFLYRQAADFMELLKSKNINTRTLITTGGHTWMNCRLFLSEAAPLLFR
ncbi:MAG TPA: alpha/beta hydrolase-fold protein [Bacteroidales bacterium]|nr:alpha/beta hydrolase-fold protein [Bacteroidales bacterium]